MNQIQYITMSSWLSRHVLIDWLDTHGIRILVIIIAALVLFFLLRRLTPLLIQRSISRQAKRQSKEEVKKRANTLSSAFIKTGKIIIAIFTIFTILPEFGVNIAAALTGLGIAGIAVALGTQNLIKDLLAGTFIILEDQYRVGDVVTVAGISGLVEEIGLRRTVLRDLDGIVHSISNNEIKISSNFTKEYSRVNINIAVAYAEDLDRVIEVMNNVCQEMANDSHWSKDFVSTPKVLRVDNLGDSGIDIKILGDTKPSRQWDVAGELRLRIKRVFDKEGIEIPWPHTKVYFGNTPPAISKSKTMSRKSSNTKTSPP